VVSLNLAHPVYVTKVKFFYTTFLTQRSICNSVYIILTSIRILQEALPDWKDKHDMLAALRACGYNPHQCIASYLDWGDTSASSCILFVFVAVILCHQWSYNTRNSQSHNYNTFGMMVIMKTRKHSETVHYGRV